MSVATTQWIIDTMEKWAPASWAIDGDNVGLIVGDRTRQVTRVLVSLDLTESVLREAVIQKFDFIVTHHPLISRHTQPINCITADDQLGKKILTLIASGIGVFCAHTNLDAAPGGVNDLLFDLIGLHNKESLIKNEEKPTLGLIGYLPQHMELWDVAKRVGNALYLPHVRYVGEPDRPVYKVGICGGRGTSLINEAIKQKCDLFITGDIDYHLASQTIENRMALMDGTHFATEAPIIEAIVDYLKKSADSQGIDLFVEETDTNGQVFKTT